MNKFLSYLSLTLVIFWLLFSYLPLTQLTNAQVTFPAAVSPIFQWFVLGIVILFLFIQLLLIRSARSIGMANPATEEQEMQWKPNDADQSQARGAVIQRARVSYAWEVAWTILPLLMTLGVVIVGYQLWSGL